IQIALVDLLTLIGIQPDGIVGHSIGELACAYADGTVTLEQTMLIAYFRGDSLISAKLEPCTMAAIGLSWEEAKKICPSDIIPACNNSIDLITVSGPIESLQTFMKKLKSKNIFAKLIDSCGFAFHSKYIAASESKLRASLDGIMSNFKPRSAKWISTSVPEAAWNTPIAQFSSPAYFVNNLLSPVLFREAITHIPENAVTIEIAPHGLLQAILHRSLPKTVAKISLQKRDHINNLAFLLSNI
ncbi:Fatty acid synthase, partial [Ooceraea biroi]